MILVYRVIFHLNDEDKAGNVVTNVENIFRDMEDAGEDIKVEILAHSSGVNVFKKINTDYKDRIISLLDKGIDIAICNNTLKANELTKEDFIEEARVVPSGVGELVRKQQKGWAYVRP